jgi:hypothetical protein
MMKVGMKYRLFSLFEINGCIGYGILLIIDDRWISFTALSYLVNSPFVYCGTAAAAYFVGMLQGVLQ